MPKVIVREYDNSSTGLATAANFAVVVPGILGDPQEDNSEVIDDNGIYECSSQADFKKYIGLIGAQGVDTRTAPTLVAQETIEADAEQSATPITSYYIGSKQMYGTDGTSTGYFKNNAAHTHVLVQHKVVDTTTSKEVMQTTGALYKIEKATGASEVGRNIVALKDSEGTTQYYKLTAVQDVLDIEVTTSTGTTYSKGNTYVEVAFDAAGENLLVGSSAIPSVNHRGNQMAYELLGMGYTVLYKVMDTNSKTAEQVLAQLTDADFWTPLKDKSIYNFRYLTTGGYMDAEAMNQIIKVAEFNNAVSLSDAQTYGDNGGRGDCIALCDFDENNVDKQDLKHLLVSIRQAVDKIDASKYAAIFGPQVYYNLSALATEPFSNNNLFPGSFHYLACASNAFKSYSEWYAVAGYKRGVPAKGVLGTTIKLGEVAINTLAPRVINDNFGVKKAVNLVLTERGNYYLWGNRTAETLNKSGLKFSHFLNIRQLCTTIKKDLYVACRQFTFDPNSDVLWANFVAAITPTLDKMQADQGIAGYRITRVKNNAKAAVTAKIRIVPIEAVEDFDISIYLEDSLEGITLSSDEAEA